MGNTFEGLEGRLQSNRPVGNFFWGDVDRPSNRVWLPSADFAVARVRDRVRLGGHSVPEETVRRRYERGLRNFFRLYTPLASTWAMYDNSEMAGMRLIATGQQSQVIELREPQLWEHLQREHGHGE